MFYVIKIIRMKYRLFSLVLAIFFIQSCNNESKDNKPGSEIDSLSKSTQVNPSKSDTLTVSLDSSGTEIFASFLDKFNKDSLFQVSRVRFPFYFKTHYCGEKVKSRKVMPGNWEMYTLIYVDSFATMKEFPFKQEILIKKNKAEVIWSAIEGDYMHDTNTFLLIDKKWFFVEYMETGC